MPRSSSRHLRARSKGLLPIDSKLTAACETGFKTGENEMSMIAELRFTYLGGPTILIEIGGLRLLTDPTFDPAGKVYSSGPVTLVKTAGPGLEPRSLGAIGGLMPGRGRP